MIILAQASLMLLSFAVPKDNRVSRWLYAPSLVLAWVGYIAYERVYIPRNCTGECNIRVDPLLFYPYLAFVTLGEPGPANRDAPNNVILGTP